VNRDKAATRPMSAYGLRRTLRALRLPISMLMICGPEPSSAHHSLTANFDNQRRITLTGELIAVDWRNPHVELVISVDDGEPWRLEGASPGYFRGNEISRAVFEERIGQIVTVEGHPPRQGAGRAALLRVEFRDGVSVEVVPCC
jgi:hypothetical protein